MLAHSLPCSRSNCHALTSAKVQSLRLFHSVQRSPCFRPQAAAGDFKGCTAPLPKPIKVVGCGSCGVDYLASILAFPKPDEKLRTDKLEVQGGGNCANALTACARLGLSPAIMTKIGGDGLGDGIITELKADNIDTQYILRDPDSPSPFTYIIVDRTGGTRTCIHTPGASFQPSEIDDTYLNSILDGAALVYFDGRLTEAALKLAERAKQLGIPILVEAERLRPNLESLLQYGNYIVTSAHFPQDWTGEKNISDAILTIAQRLPHASVIITTVGTQGSILLERGVATTTEEEEEGESAKDLETSMKELQSRLQGSSSSNEEAACISGNGISIRAGGVVSLDDYVQLVYSEDHNIQEAVNQAKDAACRAATLNAEAGNVQGYAMCPAMMQPDATVAAKVTVASIASLPKDAVVDTTGAGDAFIGAVIYGIVTGMKHESILQLASVVAATKCTALGARPGLPQRSQLTASILGSAET